MRRLKMGRAQGAMFRETSLTNLMTSVPEDFDRDGIPDQWELEHHLNPHDPVDARLVGPDGYTNLERYLNGLADAGRKP